MQEEIWKDIIGFEDRYSISSIGRVYSKTKKKFLSLSENQGGYHFFTAKVNSKATNLVVHRQVAICFLPEPSPELVAKCSEEHHGKVLVNHINGIKTDNRVENLEWVDSQQNMQHAYSTGLVKQKGGIYSMTSSVKDMEVIREIRELFVPYSPIFGASALAAKYGIARGTIYNIINNLCYKD